MERTGKHLAALVEWIKYDDASRQTDRHINAVVTDEASTCYIVTAKQVEYLGHLLTPHGIMVDPRKVAAIQDWPTPLNVSQLRGFLGLTQYYDTFMDHFADVAYPLTELLKKDVPCIVTKEVVAKASQSCRTGLRSS
eukprot:jgi/Botrbrau1/16924/Bobra.13_1s0003.1